MKGADTAIAHIMPQPLGLHIVLFMGDEVKISIKGRRIQRDTFLCLLANAEHGVARAQHSARRDPFARSLHRIQKNKPVKRRLCQTGFA